MEKAHVNVHEKFYVSVVVLAMIICKRGSLVYFGYIAICFLSIDDAGGAQSRSWKNTSDV